MFSQLFHRNKMNLLDLSGLLQTEIIDFSTLSILQQVKSLTLSGGVSQL